MNRAILYYTSNKEKLEFEQKIRDNILKVTDLSIISVSQVPIDFGKNIVVGDIGVSGFNMFRQVQKGLQESTADVIYSCEADCLYPPDYFEFIPEKLDVCYRDTNLYVMGQWREYFYKKAEGATHAQVIGREYYLERLNHLFTGCPDWSVEERNFPRERWHQVDVFKHITLFETKNPVVQIKTDRSMRHYTHSDRTPIHTIPYWNNGKTFRKEYYV